MTTSSAHCPRSLLGHSEVRALLVESNVYAARGAVTGDFDLVYTMNKAYDEFVAKRAKEAVSTWAGRASANFCLLKN